jgi:glycosyltransferase involved in cell wall biosynthesis
MPIIEAQATGRPVITSNYGAMKEVAGEGALLVDPNSVDEIREAVLKVISGERLRDNLVKRGLMNVERYKGNEIGRMYGKVYFYLVANINW